MDGVDAALLEINNEQMRVIDYLCIDYPLELKNRLISLSLPDTNDIELLATSDIAVAQLFANAVKELLQRCQLTAEQITAIGSHGQTVRHAPYHHSPYTIQIGDPNVIATETGIDVVADFRRKDIALGGQGAPLVPKFHHVYFASGNSSSVVVNIGGISNLTYLPENQNEPIQGYDIGPGNCLLDSWIKRHHNMDYDHDGKWAEQGQCVDSVLKDWLADPYFSIVGPKSSGREYFNLQWMQRATATDIAHCSAADIQKTLLVLTVESIAKEIEKLSSLSACYICGGGAYNQALMQLLEARLKPVQVFSTQVLNLPADRVEAACFAWLAHAYIQRIPANVPSVTGASKEAVLGALYLHQ
jgi:anhydro-N-acetylmuramic acid kinase